MTQKIEQIFMMQYGVNKEFKQPDNLSSTSEVEQKMVKIVSRQIQSEQQWRGNRAIDDDDDQQFDQTPIHRYSGRRNNHHRQSDQGSDGDQSRQQLQRAKVVLQFKISQLQKICSTLTSANSKLLDKIEELQGENERLKRKEGGEQQVGEDNVNNNGNNNNNGSLGNNNNNNDGSNESSSNDGQQSSIIIFDSHQSNNNNQQLSSSIQSSNNLIQQTQSNFQNQVSDIEQMIVQYRQQLKKAQQLNKNNKLYYQGRIKQLEDSVRGLRQEVESYGQLNGELEGRLKELEERNSMWEEEVEQLQQQQQEVVTTFVSANSDNNNYNATHGSNRQNHPIVANIKHHNPINVINDPTTPRSSFYSPYNPKRSAYNSTSSVLDDEYLYSQSISSTLQFQLQKLIQKLVKQLQTERSTKSKMGQQLRRIQSQLMQSQKMLSHKNQRIYQLQMQVLNYEKTNIMMSNTNSSGNNAINVINKSSALINKPVTTSAINNPTTTSNNTHTRGQYTLNHGNTNVGRLTATGSNMNTNNNNSNTNNSVIGNIGNTNVVNSPSNNTVVTGPSRVNSQIFSRKEYVGNANRNSTSNSNLNNNNNNKQAFSQKLTTQYYSPKPQQQQQTQNKQLLVQQQQSNNSITKNTLNRQPTLKQLQPQRNSNSTPTFTLNKQPQQQQPSNAPQKKLLQTCTLMQLLHNPEINLSQKQKLFISLKLILFYQQKIYKQRNYTLLKLQDILVTNFNQINLRLIIIKANTASDKQCYQADRIERMVENLAFLLNSILIDVSNGKYVQEGEGVLESCTMLREKIECILSGESVKEGDIGELRAMVEAVLE